MTFSILLGAAGELPDRAARAVVFETDPDTGEKNVNDVAGRGNAEGRRHAMHRLPREKDRQDPDAGGLHRRADQSRLLPVQPETGRKAGISF